MRALYFTASSNLWDASTSRCVRHAPPIARIVTPSLRLCARVPVFRHIVPVSRPVKDLSPDAFFESLCDWTR